MTTTSKPIYRGTANHAAGQLKVHLWTHSKQLQLWSTLCGVKADTSISQTTSPVDCKACAKKIVTL